jgi:extracellular factor (EF) 3-hydroxypalmitic acid methyl ester biosynthesis protein
MYNKISYSIEDAGLQMAMLSCLPEMQNDAAITNMQVATLKKMDAQAHSISFEEEDIVLAFLQKLKRVIEKLENVLSREEIIQYIPNIRKVAAHSPFVRRAQEWPKGYQGDFETIEHIISEKNKAMPGTAGYVIENFFISADICRQHNNKVKRQAALIADAIKINSHAKILSVGCGTSQDIKENIEIIKKSQVQITLVDVDADALKYSRQAVEEISSHVKTIQGNIYKIVRTLDDKYDAVVIGGVFDYLSEKAIIRILAALKNNMKSGGTIFFTNITNNNPYRIYMEYLSDWMLIERSAEDINRLLKESGCNEMDIEIKTDSTGLAWLVSIKCY